MELNTLINQTKVLFTIKHTHCLIFIVTLLMVGIGYTNTARATCELTPTGSQSCTYYAESNDEAVQICHDRVADLGIQGYDISSYRCWTTPKNSVIAGWFINDINGEIKHPSQFVTVEYQLQPLSKKQCPDNTVGNPCQVSTGFKRLTETDFSGALPLVRRYNSGSLFDFGLSKGWHSDYFSQLSIVGNRIIFFEGDGRVERWYKTDDQWQGDADNNHLLTEATDGQFVLTKPNGSVFTYAEDGRLLTTTTSQGLIKQFFYDATYNYGTGGDKLSQVVGPFGHQITFAYNDAGRISTVTDGAGREYRYEYSHPLVTHKRLKAVIYPDQTPDDESDNPQRLYHYENTRFPYHLTGITDENGDRYATYAYDRTGKAIVTEHAQTTNTVGQEKFELDYQGTN